MASHLILSLFERWRNWGLERLSDLSKVIELVSETTQIQAHVTWSVIMVLITYTQGTLPVALCFLLSSQSNSDGGILSLPHRWQNSKGLNSILKVVDGSPRIGSQPVFTSYNGWWQKRGRKEERLEILRTLSSCTALRNFCNYQQSL